MSKSKIEWTDETWNPVTGCTKVSLGCKHCYAERVWPRLSAPGQPYEGRRFADIQCHPERLEQPLHWKKPRRVFVNSMSDLFHEDVPDDFLDKVFAVMALCPQHTFQILTKRPERMLSYLSGDAELHVAYLMNDAGQIKPDDPHWPLKNVWLGVSVENQETANVRIPLLLRTPARVRFISIEPLLGPVLLQGRDEQGRLHTKLHNHGGTEPWHRSQNDIDWVIVGGESGPKARPMHPDWVREVRDRCQAAGVPFFFKRWGEWAPDCLCKRAVHPSIPRPQPGKIGVMFRCGKKAAGRMLDGREWNEVPA